MTPLDLLLDEVKGSGRIRTNILKIIADKKRKKISFNVTNLVFNFKSGFVEIQDECGITDERIQIVKIAELLSLLS